MEDAGKDGINEDRVFKEFVDAIRGGVIRDGCIQGNCELFRDGNVCSLS